MRLIHWVAVSGGEWMNMSFSFTIEVNDPVVFSGEIPVDGSVGVSVGTTLLNVTIRDPDGDSFNWSIETSPDIGGDYGINEFNGTKTCSVSGLGYGTTYTWWVNASDSGSGGFTNESYSFTTKYDIPPVISDISLMMSDPVDTDPSYGWGNISCTVTDNVGIHSVHLNITYPDLHTENMSMLDGGGGQYYYNTTYTSVGGDINIDHDCSIVDLILIANHFDETGSDGWIREDLNNDGDVSIVDLVLVAGHFDETW